MSTCDDVLRDIRALVPLLGVYEKGDITLHESWCVDEAIYVVYSAPPPLRLFGIGKLMSQLPHDQPGAAAAALGIDMCASLGPFTRDALGIHWSALDKAPIVEPPRWRPRRDVSGAG